MKIIGIIPIRSGSTRLKDKNIKLLYDTPLVCWTLKAAIKSKIFDGIIISSDSSYYSLTVENWIEQDISYAKDINIMFHKRKTELAEDRIKLEPIVIDILNTQFIELSIKQPDIVFIIQCTSPFVKSEDYKNALQLFKENDYNSLLTCYRLKRFEWKIDKDGNAKSLNYNTNKDIDRIDMKYYKGILLENGAFYITKTEQLIKNESRLVDPIGIYKMEGWGCDIDIDTIEDWEKAELIAKKIKGNENAY